MRAPVTPAGRMVEKLNIAVVITFNFQRRADYEDRDARPRNVPEMWWRLRGANRREISARTVRNAERTISKLLQ